MSFLEKLGSTLGRVAKGLPVVGNIITGIEEQNQANGINPIDATYAANPEIAKALALQKVLQTARMPGAATATSNIYTSGANAVTNINRNATNSAQALALASGTQGVTDAALTGLSTQEAQFALQRQAALRQAQEAQAREDRLLFEDKIRKFNNDTNKKNQLYTAGQQNVSNGFNQAANLALSAFTGGIGGTGGSSSTVPPVYLGTGNSYYNTTG